jgi:hypothetical protein
MLLGCDNMENKTLDFTGLDLVNQAHKDRINVEKIAKKSIGTDKKTEIKGETYKGKGITRGEINTYLAYALAAIATIGTITLAAAGIHHLERRSDEIAGFNMAVRNEVEENMSDTDALLFNSNQELSNKEILALVDQAESELNADDYKKITGARVDGTHNTDFDLNNGEVLNLTDKNKDAIENAAEDYVRSHR